jgi:protease-4
MAQSKAVHDALEHLKKSGKFIYSAYANMYSQKDYYLNSVANKIYINPIGEMSLGLSAEVMFFKDFQGKIWNKIRSYPTRKIQSAVEPFLEMK